MATVNAVAKEGKIRKTKGAYFAGLIRADGRPTNRGGKNG